MQAPCALIPDIFLFPKCSRFLVLCNGILVQIVLPVFMGLCRFLLLCLLFLWFILIHVFGRDEIETDDEEQDVCLSIAEHISEGVSCPVSQKWSWWLVGAQKGKQRSIAYRGVGENCTLVLDHPSCLGYSDLDREGV
jgi:hypothetical protein